MQYSPHANAYHGEGQMNADAKERADPEVDASPLIYLAVFTIVLLAAMIVSLFNGGWLVAQFL
jgi:hypothetical protein